MANASKIMGSELNNTAISIEALKSSDVGDMVLFMDDSGNLSLFKVEHKVTTRGRNGGTALTLSDMVGDVKLELPTTNTLPDGVFMVRKVLAGVNVRTLRKLAPKAAESVVVADAPADVAPAAPVEDAILGQPASTDIVLPQLDMSAPAADVSLSEPTAPVSDIGVDVAQCGAEDDISTLIAEIITLGQ